MSDTECPGDGRERSPLGYLYEGEALRCVAMPLGGLGAGQIALCGDGSLRQWQIVNQANHLGFVPHSFFAIRVSSVEPPQDVLRILQSREVMDLPQRQAPLVNDAVIPPDHRRLLERSPGVERTTFTGAYPFAQVAYEDAALPIDLDLEAWSPFIPLDAEASGLPAIVCTFHLRNRSRTGIHGCLGAALQNMVGWDGVTPISGNRCPLYGGNVNRVSRRGDRVAVIMENPLLADDHPGAGQLVLAAHTPTARALERWTEPDQFIRHMEGFHLAGQLDDPRPHLSGYRYSTARSRRGGPTLPVGPSPAGETWDGGLLVPFRLAPGETATITWTIAWYFPNRYVNFEQFGAPRVYGQSRFWLGNAYATRYTDAEEVVGHLADHLQPLRDGSHAWAESIFDSTLPDWVAEALAAQGATLRSPTTFQTADGNFFGFEGCMGASTAMWGGAYGGSCPLNCTHVWNYEQALSRLFPALERTMRETDLEVMQAPEGYIPHRVYAPLYLPQLWNETIGGPDAPALDGMLGTVLKVYRELRHGADFAWLERLWPSVRQLLTYVIERWDPDRDGLLSGQQPNTYDIAFYGANMFIGGLWLAALRAGEEMGRLQGDGDWARVLHDLFERGSAAYDGLLWNGEYYVQRLGPDDPQEHQYGEGCLSDQLFGQWWAHLLELGYILPPDRVRCTLQSIVRHNFRHGFRQMQHADRVFADEDDCGLLLCTWPHGGRPAIPVRYADEVWTGIEYQVGAHCLMEGLADEGFLILRALRARYSGTRRNPYNEIECGDHYARPLAGWAVLEALSGFRYNALGETLRFAPLQSHDPVQMPFVAGTGWGTYRQQDHGPWSRVSLSCVWGEIRMKKLTLPPASGRITASLDGRETAAQVHRAESELALVFDEPVVLSPGSEFIAIREG